MKSIISKGITILITITALILAVTFFVTSGVAAPPGQSSSSSSLGSQSGSTQYYHFDVRIAAQFTSKLIKCDCKCTNCGCEAESTTVDIDGVSIDSAIVYNTSGTTWSLSSDTSIYGTQGTTAGETTVEGVTIPSGVSYFYVNFFDSVQADENVNTEDVYEFQSIAGHKAPSAAAGSSANAGLMYVTNDTIVLTYTITYELNGQTHQKTQTLVRTISVDTNDCALKDETSDRLGFDIAISAEDMAQEQIEKTSVSVVKSWDDNDNQAGERPDSVTVRLIGKNSDSTIYSEDVVLSEENQWSYTWNDLAQYYCGCTEGECAGDGNCAKEISYSVEELNVPEGYSVSVSGSQSEGYTIINTYDKEVEPEIITIAGMVTWDDADNQDGIRPNKVTVYLYADGTMEKWVDVLVEEGGTFSFTDLPKTNNGQDIVYTVTENAINGYTTEIEGYNIKNIHVPETLDISGTKTWDDANNQDGIRPEEIEIYLYADGKKTDSIIVSENTEWKYSFTALPKYADGTEIAYMIVEKEVEGYTANVEGYDITNTHVPEKTSVKGTVTWEDKDDQDGIRPEEVTIYLYADGTKIDEVKVSEDTDWKYSFTDLPKYANGTEISYTITENEIDGYTIQIEGYDVTNIHIPETLDISGTKTWDDANNLDGIRPEEVTIYLYADGNKTDSVKVSEATNWGYSFTDLPKYADGTEISYTIGEKEVEGYTTKVKGYNVTNIHVPEKIDVTGTVTWNDKDNQDGIRPEEVTIHLYANGTEVDSITVTKDTNWGYGFTELPKYADGKEITYTISENKLEGYTTKVEGYDVTNTHVPETLSVSGKKTWDDGDDQDGIRPKEIEIYLYADGTKIDSITVTKDTNWGYKFSNLPKYAAGTEISYTIGEKKVDGYTSTVEGYNVINVHVPEEKDITGTVTWDDKNDQDGIRPDEVTIYLFADGEKIHSVTASQDTDWKYSFTELPKYVNGTEINYSITEREVEDYTTQIEGYDVTNTHVPETKDVAGTVTWDDKDDQDGIRPNEVTIYLYSNGEKVGEKVVTEEDGWKYSFSDVPKYSEGNEILYTITTDTVAEYSTTIESYDVTNKYEPKVVDKTVTNIWDDADNQDGIRPQYIVVQLQANGNNVGPEITLNEANSWSYTWEDLDQYEGGSEILYTVILTSEVKDYTVSYSQSTLSIKNTYAPGETSYTVTNVWDDDNNASNTRPEKVMVQLLADGEPYGTPVALTEESFWTYTWSELPEYNSGQLVTYSVSLLENSDVYTVTVSEDGKSTVIKNVYVPQEETNSQASVITGDDNPFMLALTGLLVSSVLIKCLWFSKRKTR